MSRGVAGLLPQRACIENYAPSGFQIVSIDDDVTVVYKKKLDAKSVEPFERGELFKSHMCFLSRKYRFD